MALPADLTRQRRELIKLWLRWRLPLGILLLVVVVVFTSGQAWRYHLARQDAARLEHTQRLGQELAATLAAAAARQRQALAGALDLEALSATLASGDAAAISARESELAAADPRVLRAWLVAPGHHEPDYETSPPLGYGALELLRIAEESGQPPPIEAVLHGQPEQHLLGVWPLGATQARSGHLVLALDAAIMQDLLRRVPLEGGFAEVVQAVPGGRSHVVGRIGDPASRQGLPSINLRIQDTHWRLAYWSPTVDESGGGLVGVPMAALAAGLALLAGLGTIVVRRRRRAQPEGGEEVPDSERGGRLSDKLASLEAVDPSPPPDPAGIVVEEAPVRAGDLPESIFRAYDVRGVVGESLDVGVVRAIGQALGSIAYDRGQQTLVVACDGRHSGPELVAALIDGLRSTGRDVIDVGRVPTPLLYFATHFLNTGSGVMVTGSHNPPEYNGLKIMLAGETLFGGDIQAIRARWASGDIATGEGSLQHMEVVDEYIRRVTDEIPVALGNSFKVVVDCGNGIAGAVAPKLIRALGHDVVELHCEVDGDFPNHHPDPAVPENLADLIATVRAEKADLGFAFDGDGDRLGMVDPDGRIIWPDQQMMLYARDVLQTHKGAEIIFDVKCSSRLGKVIRKLGGQPLMWKTGHSFIKNKLRETGAPLAGEMSGHIFFNDRWYGFDDALYASARMLELLMGFRGQKPRDIFAKLPAGVSTPELRVDLLEGQNVELMARLEAEARFDDGTVSTIDGLRVDWPDGWGLVRASNTTPSLVLRFEADSAEGLERIQERFRTLLLGLDPGLSLPF
jgi:phosphomannomutase / phosphoglucomutase